MVVKNFSSGTAASRILPCKYNLKFRDSMLILVNLCKSLHYFFEVERVSNRISRPQEIFVTGCLWCDNIRLNMAKNIL